MANPTKMANRRNNYTSFFSQTIATLHCLLPNQGGLVNKNRIKSIFLILTVFALGFFAGRIGGYQQTSAEAQTNGRVFEIRTYTTEEGRLDALSARFRDHTTR